MSEALLAKFVVVALAGLLGTAVSRLYQRRRRLESGRLTSSAPGAAPMVTEVARQRPAGFLKGLAWFFIVIGLVAIPAGAFIPDIIGVIAVAALGLLIAGIGWYILRSYQNCSLVDGPDAAIMTDWRGRTTTLRHDEVASYYRAYRSQNVIVKDVRGKKYSLNLSWFSAPLFALNMARLEAEGRIVPKFIGNPKKTANRIEGVEYAFGVRLPERFKAVLEMGPGANPGVFQRDPAAPAGQGWAGENYQHWLTNLNAALA